MRTFIAIDIPLGQDLSTCLYYVQKNLKFERLKWVSFSSLHLTLFFMGNTSQHIIASLKADLSRTLLFSPKFKLTLRGVGTFSKKNIPSVIWLGVENCPELISLQKSISSLLIPFGYVPDSRGFNPHITIARVKQIDDYKNLIRIIDPLKSQFLQNTNVERVILYESVLTSKGPIYNPIHISPLKDIE